MIEFLIGWLVIGFLTCVWSIRDDLKNGVDFKYSDIVLTIITTPFGPVFTLFCMHLCWTRSNMSGKFYNWFKKPIIRGYT